MLFVNRLFQNINNLFRITFVHFYPPSLKLSGPFHNFSWVNICQKAAYLFLSLYKHFLIRMRIKKSFPILHHGKNLQQWQWSTKQTILCRQYIVLWRLGFSAHPNKHSWPNPTDKTAEKDKHYYNVSEITKSRQK